ncbi:sensor histidine kinase [Ramlibacter tataouinensis]|uniref:histidine kinase n=1 Tax=Ramlibacter tataouinensis (strain ATCC BAA-407 / DSM 14655 / LMG 21543 / TTB310) TaxID=365046 RepID=F5Y014_RAMTT|nr:ATP-binding protein [Ramlibacter tataouinensis]AEG94563.1 candidate histidine kinase, classic [Ramlibacter tataouinensis TTB310]
MGGPSTVAPWADLSTPSEPLAEDSAFFRLWRGFGTARVAVAAVLLALLGAMFAMGPPSPDHHWLLGLCATYFAATVAVRLFTRPLAPGRQAHLRWVPTIGIDLLAISALQYLQAGGLNYSPLFAIPVLMASVLGSVLLAFGTAAAVTLLLLADAWLLSLQADPAPRFLQAGLTGFGYFALALLANQLAVRLAREEKRARLSQRAARLQAQVNELVIETLGDGVLVLDITGSVHAANPAAREMLGCTDLPVGRPFALGARREWVRLLDLAQLTFQMHEARRGEISLPTAAGQPRRIRVRTRLAAPGRTLGENLCLVFLEDLREMEARLRTEKLAAMGRMSTAVAHEIRNPLAAITQANALLEEDLADPGLRQLSGLIRQNAQRLSQIVEEILNVARVQQPGAAAPVLALDASVDQACRDWAQQTRSGERLQLSLHAPNLQVQFDEDHLRRILVNLLDNALRYAGQQPDSLQVATSSDGAQAALSVWSDGPPLEPGVQRHLFEPFFSSESRSSGLGLYICRELCERHGAQIGYRRSCIPGAASREGNEFFVSFRLTHGRQAGGGRPAATMSA